MRVTQDALSLPRLQVTVIHRNHDEAAITGRALCSLVMDWVRKQMEEEELLLDSMREKVRGYLVGHRQREGSSSLLGGHVRVFSININGEREIGGSLLF